MFSYFFVEFLGNFEVQKTFIQKKKSKSFIVMTLVDSGKETLPKSHTVAKLFQHLTTLTKRPIGYDQQVLIYICWTSCLMKKSRYNEDCYNEDFFTWYFILIIPDIIIFVTSSVWYIYYKILPFTAWKVSKYGVISGLYFPVLSLNTGNHGPELTPYLDTFHVVILLSFSYYLFCIFHIPATSESQIWKFLIHLLMLANNYHIPVGGRYYESRKNCKYTFYRSFGMLWVSYVDREGLTAKNMTASGTIYVNGISFIVQRDTSWEWKIRWQAQYIDYSDSDNFNSTNNFRIKDCISDNAVWVMSVTWG